MMPRVRCLSVFGWMLVLAGTASAQVEIVVSAEKRVFVPGESVVLTVTATNAGKKAAPYTIPEELLGGFTVMRITDGKPETLVQGAPAAGKESTSLAPGQSWSGTADITAKLGGEAAYQVGWKSADAADAKMATFAVWKPETLAAIKDTVVRFETTHGPLALEFLPELAPVSVQSFLNLSRNGYYRGKTFHRVIAGFMMQGGCPAGSGNGNLGYRLAGEFGSLKHDRGVLAMAREKNPDSAGCQFYINFGPSPWLDGTYTIFGRMIWGDETLLQVEKVLTDHHTLKGKCGANHRDLPLEDVKILEVKVGTRADFPPPAAGGDTKGG